MIVIIYALICALFDVKFYKIPNVLCLFIGVNGMFFSCMKFGLSNLDCIVLGMLLPLLFLYGLFYCGALGAGDIKEFMSLGTFFGKNILKVLILSFFFNGVIAMIKMKKESSFSERFCYFKGYIRDCRLEGRLLDDYESGKEDRIHFSIGILCAVIMVVWMNC